MLLNAGEKCALTLRSTRTLRIKPRKAGYLHYKGFPILCKRSEVLSFHS